MGKQIDIDKLFDGMAKAEIFGKGNYLEEGLYVLESKNFFVKEGHKGTSFVSEFTVVESNNAAHPAGSTASWVINFDNDYIFGNISELVIALLGQENTRENQVDAAFRDEVELITRAVCGSKKAQEALGGNYSEGMLNGIRVKVETKKKATQKGGEYTAHKWSPVRVPEAESTTAG